MRHLQNKKGQGTMEYVLIAAMVVGLIVYLINHVKQPVTKNIDSVASGLNTPTN